MKSSGWDTPRGITLDAIFCWFVAVGGGVEEVRGVAEVAELKVVGP